MICSLSSIYSYSPLLTKKLHPHAALQLHNESSYLFRNSVCHTALLASKKDDVGSSLGGRSSEVESNSRGIFASLKSSPWFWKGAMMLICIIWSTNFAVIKQLFDALPPGVLDPSLYTAIRFTIAAVVMSPGAVGSLNKPGLVMNGILAGLCVFTGYFGQSIGLMHSTANKAAFFCSMNVVWVALVSGVMTKSFKKKTWLAVLLAVSGVGFLELRGTVVPSINDLWLLLQPLGFGTGYLVLERNMRDYPGSARAITSLKLITLSILTIIWALANGHSPQDVLPIFQNKVATLSILYTSLVTTAFAIYLQSIVFKKVTSTDASIILTTEPIWATLFSAGQSVVLLRRVVG